MMKVKLLFLTLIIHQLLCAQAYHDTQGKLEISNSGQATYTLPIAMPPSLGDVAPIINLNYSSAQLGGIAGQGWSINSISNISRISTRIDIDGYIDGVDFDSNDKLSLDGQRLLIKTGTYWADGSTYQTENQSNNRIQLIGSGAAIYFVVTGPDGSRTWYGNYGGINATDLTAWYVVRFENTDGNYMTYHYANHFASSLCISEIKFSANTNGLAPINNIKFNYKLARRSEFAYVKGTKYEKKAILDNIEVRTNGLPFRKYQLTHIVDPKLGYEKVSQLQEFNGAMEPANPVIFEYNQTTSQVPYSQQQISYVNTLDFSAIELSGDFDGDGRMDFFANNKLYTKLFQSNVPPSTLTANGLGINKLALTTLTNNKLNDFQSIGSLTVNDNSLNIAVYNFQNGIMEFNYGKTVAVNNLNTCYSECPYSSCLETPRNYPTMIEGDFNGDGISEYLMITDYEHTTYTLAPLPDPPPPNSPIINGLEEDVEKPDPGTGPGNTFCKKEITKIILRECFMLDMNPNSSTVAGSQGYAKILENKSWLRGSKRYVADFNGDGKSDVLIMSETNSYKIVGFKQLDVAPWVEMELLGNGVLDTYSETKQILFGDYNGDGKTDIMLPETEGGQNNTIWNVYYSNPSPSGGQFFVKQREDIVEYWPNTGSHFDTQVHVSNYYSMDTNGDGKSDLVRVWRKRSKKPWSINDHDTYWIIETFSNNVGNTGFAGNSFSLDYSSESDNHNDSPDLPMPVASSYRYTGLDRDLVMVRNHHNELTYITFAKDVAKDVLLKKIISSGGNIVDEITYSGMEPLISSNNGQGMLSDFYSSATTSTYPFVDIKQLPKNYLVSRIKNTVEGNVKYQDFKYHGLVVNLRGLGLLGFNKSSRSMWYQQNEQKKVWSVTENNPLWRGATFRSYSQLIGSGSTFSFTLSGIPNGIINSTVNDFDQQTESNGLYKMVRSTETVMDYVTGVSTETSYGYDPEYYLPTSTVSKNFLNGQLQGISTSTTAYSSNAAGSGSSYFIGRPSTTLTKNEAYGDVFENTAEYYYTGSHLTKIKKRGNTADSKYLVEDIEYGTYGNIKKKTASAEGYARFIEPRSVEYTYDATGRFIKTTTDIEGLSSTNVAYHSLYGLVTQLTDPFGKLTSKEYDNWGKLINITSSTGLSVTTSYYKAGNDFMVTSLGNDGSASSQRSDALGRLKTAGVRNVDGSWSYKTSEYDYLGREYRKSEPFSSGSASQWNTTLFDDYNRITSSVSSTGLVTNLTYQGLKVSASDGVKNTSSTKNANGHVISSSDNGGEIQYLYYANGNLKESNFEGYKIRMNYDEWGRKTWMDEPSAGIYNYEYYASGEIYKEKTPKGTTTYTLDAAGKLLEKYTEGDLTSMINTYSYYPDTKLLRFLDGYDNYNGYAQVVEYIYDDKQRLKKTWENNIDFYYEKNFTYDTVGRIDKEITLANHPESGKSVTNAVRNTYKNGAHWQILDDATGSILWQANTVNARGQLTSARLGNGVAVSNFYDAHGFPTLIKHDRTGSNTANLMSLSTDFNPQRGNLNSRTNSLFGWTENFGYDSLDRLISFTDQNGSQEDQVYDNKGRITENNLGKYVYSNSQSAYRNTSVELDAAAAAHYSNREGIFNDSMEEEKGWTTYWNPASLSYDTARSHSGEKSIKMVNPSSSEITVFSEKRIPINNTIDTEYTYSAWVYSENAQSEVFLYMGTENVMGAFDIADNIITNQSGSWIKMEKTVLVPASMKYLSLRLDNNGNGTVWYDDVRIKKTSVQNTDTRQLNITYNTFKDPVQIEETGIDKVSFLYNGLGTRNQVYYGGMQDDFTQRSHRKYYSNAGDVEIKFNKDTDEIEFTQFIGGDGYSAPLLIRSDGNAREYLYLHRDYQGTILAISNQQGDIVEKRLFDAWGNIAKVIDGQGNILDRLTVLDRGYTGHEHLQSVGLIHMNGRLYDSKVKRFLQPDNFVQDPYNTQNYNRYGYVLNNPLKYTDVSGEEFTIIGAAIIGAVIAVTTYTITALVADVPFSFGGLAKSAIIGAISGAVTFGIGEYATSICQFGSRIAFQAVAHGTFQGMMSGIQGGDFWTGFAAGAISSAVSSLWAGGSMDKGGAWGGAGGSFGRSDFGTLAFGTIAGGAGAVLTGGNFWQGAATGLAVSLLNHVAHKLDDVFAKRRFDKEIDVAYGNKADSAAPANDATLIEMKNKLPTLKALYPKTGNAQLESSELYSVGAAEAKTFAYDTDNYTKANSVFYRSSFSSYRNLAHNMLHEFGHAVHYFNGDFYKYMKGGTRTNTQLQNWREQYAFKFAFDNGGRPYQNDSWYLINK